MNGKDALLMFLKSCTAETQWLFLTALLVRAFKEGQMALVMAQHNLVRLEHWPAILSRWLGPHHT